MVLFKYQECILSESSEDDKSGTFSFMWSSMDLRVAAPELRCQDPWLREFQCGFNHLGAVTFMLPLQVNML